MYTGVPTRIDSRYVFHDGEECSRLRILHRGVGAVRNYDPERSWQRFAVNRVTGQTARAGYAIAGI